MFIRVFIKTERRTPSLILPRKRGKKQNNARIMVIYKSAWYLGDGRSTLRPNSVLNKFAVHSKLQVDR